MARKKSYTLRFTTTQNHFMRANAHALKLPKWEERFQAWFETRINLRNLTSDQIRDLRAILDRGGHRVSFGQGRAKTTRRALRHKLRVLEEFTGLSAIDRLGDLGRR